MNTDNIHGDSLLSNISNISVKIDHTQIDDPGFFKHICYKNNDENSMNGQIPIDAIDDNQQFDQSSLMERVYFKYKPGVNNDNNYEQQRRLDGWIENRSVQGMSEEQNSHSREKVPITKATKKQKPQEKLQENPQLSSETKRLQAQLQRRLKNQTKNIPKNYGKAIITFIQKYEPKVRFVLNQEGIEYQDFLSELKQKKKVINTIADLRSIWVDYKYAKCMRLLSNLFLRKYSLSYIFNSRICNYSSHIKYRYRLSEAIKEPYSFKHIKDY